MANIKYTTSTVDTSPSSCDISSILVDTAKIQLNYGTSTGWQYHNCVCCGRDIGLPSGSRGLCDGCDEDIPDHIPEEQYLTYMKELWRKK
jgi:hypothetical protein